MGTSSLPPVSVQAPFLLIFEQATSTSHITLYPADIFILQLHWRPDPVPRVPPARGRAHPHPALGVKPLCQQLLPGFG